ncbi:MAG TPA: helix-turn-helix transcriptional regulator [Chloroflexota bacterium]|nr:helix-turn-helix transcriptional regulator [Chloroflexota bacterium]
MDPSAWVGAFGAAVRARRLEMGLSQESLADTCHLHRTYIGSVERGERNVSLENIVRIAGALKTSPSELLGRAEELVQPTSDQPHKRSRRGPD